MGSVMVVLMAAMVWMGLVWGVTALLRRRRRQRLEDERAAAAGVPKCAHGWKVQHAEKDCPTCRAAIAAEFAEAERARMGGIRRAARCIRDDVLIAHEKSFGMIDYKFDKGDDSGTAHWKCEITARPFRMGQWVRLKGSGRLVKITDLHSWNGPAAGIVLSDGIGTVVLDQLEIAMPRKGEYWEKVACPWSRCVPKTGPATWGPTEWHGDCLEIDPGAQYAGCGCLRPSNFGRGPNTV